MPVPPLPPYPKELSKAAWEKAKGTAAKLFDANKLKLISDGLGLLEGQAKGLTQAAYSVLDAAKTHGEAQKAVKDVQPKIKSVIGLAANARKVGSEAKKIGDELSKGLTTKATGKVVLTIAKEAGDYSKQLDAFGAAVTDACKRAAQPLPTFEHVMGTDRLRAGLKAHAAAGGAPEVFAFLEAYGKGVSPANAGAMFNTFISPKGKMPVNVSGDTIKVLGVINQKTLEKADAKEKIAIWQENWGVAEKEFSKAENTVRINTLKQDLFMVFRNSAAYWNLVKP